MHTVRGMHWIIAILIFTMGCSSVKESKEKAALHLQLGASLYESGNYPQALNELLQAEKIDPRNPLTQNNLGLVYWARQRFDLAEKHLRLAVSLDPQFTDARNNLARVFIEQKKFNEAEDQMKKVMADLTYSALDKAYFNRGLLSFNQGKWAEAEKAFRQSIEAQRDNCYATTYLGRTYFERKNYDQAATIFDRAINLCKKIFYDEPHYYSALTYYRMGQREQSQARFEEIIKNYPDGKFVEKSRSMLQLFKRKEI